MWTGTRTEPSSSRACWRRSRLRLRSCAWARTVAVASGSPRGRCWRRRSGWSARPSACPKREATASAHRRRMRRCAIAGLGTSSGPRSRMSRAIGIWRLLWATPARARARCWARRVRLGKRRATRFGARPCRASRPRAWRAARASRSRTLASLEHAWGQGRDQLTGRDVLVIDEAGLVGSRQMERVLSPRGRGWGQGGAGG